MKGFPKIIRDVGHESRDLSTVCRQRTAERWCSGEKTSRQIIVHSLHDAGSEIIITARIGVEAQTSVTGQGSLGRVVKKIILSCDV